MNRSKQQDQTYSPIITKSLGLRLLKSLQQNGKVATILKMHNQPMQVECNFESWEDTKIRKHFVSKNDCDHPKDVVAHQVDRSGWIQKGDTRGQSIQKILRQK